MGHFSLLFAGATKVQAADPRYSLLTFCEVRASSTKSQRVVVHVWLGTCQRWRCRACMAQPLKMQAGIEGDEDDRSWLIRGIARLGRVNNDTLISYRLNVVKVRLGIEKLVDILAPKLF